MLHPVKASEWVGFSEAHKQILRSVGGRPVNDVFFPLIRNTNPINLLFGSYGSGKSVFIAQELIRCCCETKYFKCYFGRKVYDDVRESCFETIVETIEDMGLQDLFHYSKAQTSSMVIVHKATGNKFVPFGAKDPAQLKSIKDPTHFWLEELDQFEDGDGEKMGDFQLIYPRLRTTKAITQFYGSFNTAAVYETHWILKYFFPERYKGEDKPQFDILEGMDVNRCFSTYQHNYFIDREKYYLQLKMASGGNQLILRAIADGEWGATDNKNPWLYAFSDSHVKDDIRFIPSFPVYLSFDFNNDPFACTAWQYSPQMGKENSFIHCLKEFSGMFKIEEMCQRIRTTYPGSIIHVTGDRSGQNEDIGRNQTLYQMIAAHLGIHNKMLDLNNSNLEHSDSRFLMNAMFANYPNLFISRKGCPNLISQCYKAKTDEKSSKPSHLLKDREGHKNDEFDSMRYLFQTYFHKFAKDRYFKVIKKHAT